MKRFFGLLIIGLLGIGFAAKTIHAQAPAAAQPAAQESNVLSLEELDALVGRIALYPDELIAITLPASTYPVQIVQAARFLQKKAKNPELIPRQDWDPSILGLLNYPEVIKIMNEDLDWTGKLGEAVIAQQKDVMDAIQQMRLRAHAAGNLVSNEKQIIVEEKQTIIIKSADPQVIYVPQYNPRVIYVSQPAPVAIVYSNPYPVYYNPAATFFTGMFVGAAISYGMNWNDHGIDYHHGNQGGNVNIDNSKNVNLNKGGDKIGNGNRPGNRPGGGEKWKPGKGSGTRPGIRPGSNPRVRPGSRPQGSLARRPANRVGTPTRSQSPRATTSAGRSRAGKTGYNPQRGRQGSAVSRSENRGRSGSKYGRQSSRSGAFSGLGRGSRQKSYSSRGRNSRSISRGGGGRSRATTRSRSSSRGGRGGRGGGRRR